jgi:hypothetical protein
MDVQGADPRTRRIAVIVVAIGALAGALLIAAMQSQLGALQSIAADNPALIKQNLGIITWALIAAVVVPVWAVNIYLWRLGSRIVMTGQFPPPGMKVLQDTPVLRDSAARKCGRLLQIVGAVTSVAALGMAIALWRLAAAGR